MAQLSREGRGGSASAVAEGPKTTVGTHEWLGEGCHRKIEGKADPKKVAFGARKGGRDPGRGAIFVRRTNAAKGLERKCRPPEKWAVCCWEKRTPRRQ